MWLAADILPPAPGAHASERSPHAHALAYMRTVCLHMSCNHQLKHACTACNLQSSDLRNMCMLCLHLNALVLSDVHEVISMFAGMMPLASSPLVKRLQKANGVVLGKTRMHELAFGVRLFFFCMGCHCQSKWSTAARPLPP